MPLSGEIRAFGFDATGLDKQGWLECDGTEIASGKFPELEKRIGKPAGFPWGSPSPSTGVYRLPDLRGMFIRGWQHDRTAGGDPDATGRKLQPGTSNPNGNCVGSLQESENKIHFHNRVFNPEDSRGAKFAKVGGITQGQQHVVMDVSSTDLRTSDAGGNESRPANAYVTYCIYALKDTAG